MMTLQYIRDHYGVPAKRGAKIKFQGRPYVIVGAARHQGHYLRARMLISNGPGLPLFPVKTIDTLHPTWEVEYPS